jgi:hypothetical protein
VTAETGADGEAVLRVTAGSAMFVLAHIGFLPDTVTISLRRGQDTTITVDVEPQVVELEGVVVSATRSERRVEDTPLRVEVVDEEEVAEKASMTPGDIAMMLNETSGIRVQPSCSPMACRCMADRLAGWGCSRFPRSILGARRSSRERRPRCMAAARSVAS